jgi:hypothetical protein
MNCRCAICHVPVKLKSDDQYCDSTYILCDDCSDTHPCIKCGRPISNIINTNVCNDRHSTSSFMDDWGWLFTS